jgi:Protein of unknown function (DUF2726)
MPTSEQRGCLLAIFSVLGIRSKASASLPYRRKDYLLTKAERSLFGVLSEAVKDRHFIFAKVRLADLVWLPKGTESRQSHFNKVQSKHVDFVICDRASVRPLVCVELDDASHSESKRQTRDAFVDAALRAAGLPLIRVPARRAYNVADLQRQLEAAFVAG